MGESLEVPQSKVVQYDLNCKHKSKKSMPLYEKPGSYDKQDPTSTSLNIRKKSKSSGGVEFESKSLNLDKQY